MSIGVVIVTHYSLGDEFLQALAQIVPESPSFLSVSVDPGQGVDDIRENIRAALKAAKTWEGQQ